MDEKEGMAHGSGQRSENRGRLWPAEAGRPRGAVSGGGLLEAGPASALRAPALAPVQEELEFCEKLLQTCFSSPTDDSMDR